VDWKGRQVRLLGVTATRLQPAGRSPAGQLSLFARRPDTKRDLARTVDTIQQRFGRDAITRASLLDPSSGRKGRGKKSEGRMK
jgi:hypothetical protein